MIYYAVAAGIIAGALVCWLGDAISSFDIDEDW